VASSGHGGPRPAYSWLEVVQGMGNLLGANTGGAWREGFKAGAWAVTICRVSVSLAM
jgi:hypothetical protein